MDPVSISIMLLRQVDQTSTLKSGDISKNVSFKGTNFSVFLFLKAPSSIICYLDFNEENSTIMYI